MKKLLSMLLLGLALINVAHAAIKFTVTNKALPSHQGHKVNAVLALIDRSNQENVLLLGVYDALHGGLSSGATLTKLWESGWLFRRDISGYYEFYVGCNADDRIYVRSEDPKYIFISDGTTANVEISCALNEDGYLKLPAINVQLQQ